MAPFGDFQTLLRQFGLLPGTIHLLVRPVLDRLNMGRGALPLLVGGGEAGSTLILQSFDLAALSITLSLQTIPLVQQIFS